MILVIINKGDLLSRGKHEETDSRIMYHIYQIDLNDKVIQKCSEFLNYNYTSREYDPSK